MYRFNSYLMLKIIFSEGDFRRQTHFEIVEIFEIFEIFGMVRKTIKIKWFVIGIPTSTCIISCIRNS